MTEQREYRYSPPAPAGALPRPPRLLHLPLHPVALSADLPHTAHPARTTPPLLQFRLPSRRTPQTQMITTTTGRRPTDTPTQH